MVSGFCGFSPGGRLLGDCPFDPPGVVPPKLLPDDPPLEDPLCELVGVVLPDPLPFDPPGGGELIGVPPGFVTSRVGSITS